MEKKNHNMSIPWEERPRDLCSYQEACYRINPHHLSEYEHPHLEKIVLEQGLDAQIKVPENLDFPCNNRKVLHNQLCQIQTMMKTQKVLDAREKCCKGPPSASTSHSSTRQSTSTDRGDDTAVNHGGKEKRSASTDDQAESKRLRTSEQASKGKTFLEQYLDCQSFEDRFKFCSAVMDKAPQFGLDVPTLHCLRIENFVSNPYSMFLATVEKSPTTHLDTVSMSFPQILDMQLGEIESSLHINFVVDIGWLSYQYILAKQKNDMLIVYGCNDIDLDHRTHNIKAVAVKMPMSFGVHHSKISIFKYADEAIRILISTANLYEDDWKNRTQGFWFSPLLPKLDKTVESYGDSPTGFKKDFEQYLLAYDMPDLISWIDLIRSVDFSQVNAFFIGSVPGTYSQDKKNLYGHLKVRSLLNQHCKLPEDSPKWNIIANSSSIGSLGKSFDEWLGKDIVPSLSAEKQRGAKGPPKFKFIFPTKENYRNSFDIKDASCCLCYSMKSRRQQEWFEKYMHQWTANCQRRTEAVPHIKTYARVSPDLTKIGWFILTSANLSKAAWGKTNRNSVTIWNYEAGVLLLPEFVTGKETFPLDTHRESETPPFPIPYDLPLTDYSETDEPFVTDFFF